MPRSFGTLGFFSPEVEQVRDVERVRLQEEFIAVEAVTATALDALRSLGGFAVPGHLVGLGFWLRCIGSCQGTVLLAERGLASSSYATLRAAYECLFVACALWRKPGLVGKLDAWHHQERVKQAAHMLREGTGMHALPDDVLELAKIAAEEHPSSSWSHWEAACAADLKYEYATIYRGLGLAGAHASLRSLDGFHQVQSDGTIDLQFQPTCDRLKWVLDLTSNCLGIGISRHREISGELAT